MGSTTSLLAVDTLEDKEYNSPVILLGEPTSGKILAGRGLDEKSYPASITKIMTLLVAMEKIEAGEASLGDKVVVSDKAEGIEGTTLFLERGNEILLEDLLKGIAVGSANDASVAVAEHLAGSVDVFVDKMNERGKELGMENTNFTNPHGLHDDNHYTTARDVFKMSRKLIKYEKLLDWFTVWMDESFLEGVINEEGVFLANTNDLIKWYPNCDGLKTGYTDQAGHGIAATAERDGKRFVSIVLKSESSQDRFNEAAMLLDYGFSNFEVEKLFSKGEKIKEVDINKGEKSSAEVVAGDDLVAVYPRSGEVDVEVEIELDDLIEAPVNKGEEVGKAFAHYDVDSTEISLLTRKEVERGSTVNFLRRIIENWVLFGN